MTEKNQSNRTEAAALRYDLKDDKAPVIIAKGRGEIAEQIINIAQENDIPLENDKDLVKVLLELEVEEEIPEELYQAVAEILGFILDLDKLS